MAFSVKAWLDKFGSGGAHEAPSADDIDNTHMDATAMRDLETRLSGYTDSTVLAHTADTSAAHAASAVSFSPTGTIAGTDVQAAVAEVASERVTADAALDTRVASLESAQSGSGLPSGGTTGQALVKASNTDGDGAWHSLVASDVGAQPVDSDLTAIAALTTTTFGRAFLTLADAAAGRTALGAEVAGAATAAQAASQPLDSDLTAIAALTTTSYGRALLALADAAAGRTAFGLGTAAVTALDVDGTLITNSDVKVASQKAVKTYVDTAVLKPGVTSPNLRGWQRALALARSGDSTARVLAVGDSITAAYLNPTLYDSWGYRLQQLFTRQFGEYGSGIVFVGSGSGFGLPDPRFTVAGTTTPLGGGPIPSMGSILELSPGATVTIPFFGDRLTFWNLGGSGYSSAYNGQVVIDGGAPTTLSAVIAPLGVAQHDVIASSGVGWHTAVVSVEGGSGYHFVGFEVGVGVGGVHVGWLGKVSAPISLAGTGNNSTVPGDADLVLLLFETNDYDIQTAIATYKTTYGAVIAAHQAQGADVALITTIPPNFTGSHPIALSDYTTAIYELGAQYGCDVIDIAQRWGDVYDGSGPAAGLYIDAFAHPNPAGGYDIASAVFSALMRSEDGPRNIPGAHILSAGSRPTAVVGTAAGTSPGTPAVAGSDAGERLTVTTGTSPTTGTLLTVTFGAAYSAAPAVTLSPQNAASQATGAYPSSVTTTGYVITCPVAPAGSTALSFAATVIGTA